MKKADIKIGAHYEYKAFGATGIVHIEACAPSTERWIGRDIKTGKTRLIIASILLREVPAPGGTGEAEHAK